MTWEQLVIAVLLILALMVQLMRVLKGTVEDEQADEAEAVSMPVAIKRRAPIRESCGPSDEPRVARSAMEEFPATRCRRPRVAADARGMRRGIMLMAVLGPCRGLKPYQVSRLGLDRG